jgi:O-antigen/teichoic acid export membrane protein
MRVALNTGSKYASHASNLLIGFFLTPFLLNHLGAEMLGVQVIAIQALQYCTLLGVACSRGYSRFATVHYARRDFPQMNQTLGQGLSLTLALTVIAMLVIWVLSVYADRALGLSGEPLRIGRWVILIIGAGYVFDQFSSVWGALLFMTERLYVEHIAQLVARVIAAAGVVLLFTFSSASLLTWVALTVGSTIAIKLIYMIPSARRSVPAAAIGFKAPRGQAFRQMSGFSAASLVGGLGFLLFYASGPIIIANLPELGAGKVMAYNLGQRWDPQLREVVLAVAAALTPVFTSLYANGDYGALKRTFLVGTRRALLLSCFPCVILFVYATDFIRLWVGDEFASESGLVLRISIVNVWISVAAIVGYEALVGMGKIGRVGWLMVAGGIANVFLGIALASWLGLGLMGIALSTLITYSTFVCAYILFAVKTTLRISMGELIQSGVLSPFKTMLPLAATALTLRHLVPVQSWTALGLQWTGCFVVYLAAVVVAGLTGEERARVLMTLRNVVGALKERWRPSAILSER